jgi:Fic family protein
MPTRLPPTPPEFHAILSQIVSSDAFRLSQVLRSVDGPLVDGKYLHWDKVRYRKPPADLTLDEWWLALKANRRHHLTVPLVDRRGRPFTSSQAQLLSSLHQIDLGAGGQIGIPDHVLNTQTRDSYVARSLVEEAFTSSQLEGAASTRAIAKELVRKERLPRTPGERMILNNYRTMERIRDLKAADLTPDLVFEIHRIVTEDTLEDDSAGGRLRRDDEHRVVADDYGTIFHNPPPAGELRDRMALMCDFANDRAAEPFVHPVIRSMVLHFWLAYDHPFVDGNGRTARALFYWSMLRRGYWLVEFISISSIILRAPVQYLEAFLHTETDSNDLTYFLIYHAGVVQRALDELSSYIRNRTQELAELQANMRGLGSLNYRQRELIRHALRHPGTRYTVESHRASHGISQPTAREDLLDLTQQGLLKQSQMGRAHIFIAAGDLEERLRHGRQS